MKLNLFYKVTRTFQGHSAFVPPPLSSLENYYLRLLTPDAPRIISPKYRQRKRKRLSHYYHLTIGEYL